MTEDQPALSPAATEEETTPDQIPQPSPSSTPAPEETQPSTPVAEPEQPIQDSSAASTLDLNEHQPTFIQFEKESEEMVRSSYFYFSNGEIHESGS